MKDDARASPAIRDGMFGRLACHRGLRQRAIRWHCVSHGAV